MTVRGRLIPNDGRGTARSICRPRCPGTAVVAGQGTGVVGVVVVGLTALGAVLVKVCVVAGVVALVVGVGPVAVGWVAVGWVVVGWVVVVAGAVLLTVVTVVVVVSVKVGLAVFFGFAEPPKNVVAWPLPVIERPASRSGTV